MAFTKLVQRGGEQYQRIDCAKVQTANFSDEEMNKEADSTALLTEERDEMHSDDNGNADELQYRQQNAKLIWRHGAFAFARKSLPQQGDVIMKLHIRKMDNTFFALEVSEKATVLELKRALQRKFDSSGCQISWPHVWGNFCLSFKNEKLLDNSIVLHQIGIGDSDELYFVRHLTMSSGERRGFFNGMRKKQASST